MTTKKFTLGRTPRETASQRGRHQETDAAHVDHFVAAREPETTKTFRIPVSLSRRLRIHAAQTAATWINSVRRAAGSFSASAS